MVVPNSRSGSHETTHHVTLARRCEPINIFRPYLKYGRKIIHSNGAFFYPMFPKCVHLKLCRPNSFNFVRKKFENPKMFVWISRIQFCQPCRFFCFFLKKVDIFEKKNRILFKIGIGGNNAVECVSNDFIS